MIWCGRAGLRQRRRGGKSKGGQAGAYHPPIVRAHSLASSHIGEIALFDRLHRNIGRGRGDIWQRRDFFGQNATIGRHILNPHLQQVVEISRDQMRLLNLGNAGHGGVERGERGLSGICQAHLDESDVVKAQADRIKYGAVAKDKTLGLQPAQAGLRRAFRQANLACKIRYRDAPIGRHCRQNRPVKPVQAREVILSQFPLQIQHNRTVADRFTVRSPSATAIV